MSSLRLPRVGPVVGQDQRAERDTFVADLHARPGQQPPDLALGLAAPRAAVAAQVGHGHRDAGRAIGIVDRGELAGGLAGQLDAGRREVGPTAGGTEARAHGTGPFHGATGPVTGPERSVVIMAGVYVGARGEPIGRRTPMRVPEPGSLSTTI